MIVTKIKALNKRRATKIREYQEPKITGEKALKTEAKENLKVIVNGVKYDADTKSILYISSRLARASFEFGQLLGQGLTNKEAYDKVYNSTITWKDANNQLQNITVEILAKIYDEIMDQIEKIIGIK